MEEIQKILVIDDDPIYRNLSRSILKERFAVFTAETPSKGFGVLDKEDISIVICDFMLPEMNGVKVLERIKKSYQGIELIMISDSDDMETVIGALRNGAADYFRKPFSAAEMWMSIERTLKLSKLQKNLKEEKKKNLRLKEEAKKEYNSPIIGASETIVMVKNQISMVAQTPDTSVLIIGDSGTGKELVARSIHDQSNRCDEFFGAVNMSAIPESLFESEFFGHKKGSFTGAITDKAGWFETSNKGTLFLDEIGDMSMALQVKLLRVLEDRTFTKVGTQKAQDFDVRIIAATNKSVEELSSGKTFRLDLFHRLGTFIIPLSPLNKRAEDIEELAYFFLEKISKKMGRAITEIDNGVLDILQKYPFPGNIRELRNLMERAVIVCQGEKLMPAHFPTLQLAMKSHSIESDTFDLQEIEKRTIIKALEKVHYNKAEAARLLNIEWNALYRRIKKYNIEMLQL